MQSFKHRLYQKESKLTRSSVGARSAEPRLIAGTTPYFAAAATWFRLLLRTALPCLLLLTFVACGSEQAAEEAETIVIQEAADTAEPDTAFTPAETVPDSTSVTQVTPLPSSQPKEAPRQQTRQPSQPQPTGTSKVEPQPTPAPAPAAATGFREGVYQLTKVQGESLPLVLDMTTECDTKLLKGELILRAGRFQFQSFVAEECAAQLGPAERQEAEGTYRLEDNKIFLRVMSGEVLGDAQGIVSGTSIRLQQISNDEEQQEVDWLFQLQ